MHKNFKQTRKIKIKLLFTSWAATQAFAIVCKMSLHAGVYKTRLN